jgi:hypothetical protein
MASAQSAPSVRSILNSFFLYTGVSLARCVDPRREHGALPVLIIFLIFQRYFIEGVTLTGIKG